MRRMKEWIMVNYLLKQLNNGRYYLICIDPDSILNYLDELRQEPLLRSNAGELIVDQLLVTGNGRNRFLACQFSCGEIMLHTAKKIDSEDFYRRISVEALQQNINLLDYSILTEDQVEAIRQGQIV